MSTLMSTTGKASTRPIPSLRFSLSTPPNASPDEEDAFIPHGAKTATEARFSSDEINNSRHECSSNVPKSGTSFKQSPPETITSMDMTAGKLGMEDPELVSVASDIVSMVIVKAKEKAENKSVSTGGVKFQEEEIEVKQELNELDPELLEMVRKFVADVLEKAKEEAIIKMEKNIKQGINIYNNNVLFSKGRNILFPGRGQEVGRGPWYARAIRFLSTIFGRMCPCKTPGAT